MNRSKGGNVMIRSVFKPELILLYVVFCIIGAGFEWLYGAFWGAIGITPWIYPDSPVHYTSLEGLPLWGFSGFICVSAYKTIADKRIKSLAGAIVPIILAALWIVFCSYVLQ